MNVKNEAEMLAILLWGRTYTEHEVSHGLNAPILAAAVRRIKKLTRERDEARREWGSGTALHERCFFCGHRMRGASDHCPQCGENLGDVPPWQYPKEYPDECECGRCERARKEDDRA